MVWICKADWSFSPVWAFRPVKNFGWFGDLEWSGHLIWISHFHQFGHLDWLRPFASLAIWNGLDMRNGLCISTGLGIETASHLWALCVGIFWTFEVDWSFSPISFPESSLPLTSGQTMRDNGSIHFRHAHRCRLPWNRMSQNSVISLVAPRTLFFKIHKKIAFYPNQKIFAPRLFAWNVGSDFLTIWAL